MFRRVGDVTLVDAGLCGEALAVKLLRSGAFFTHVDPKLAAELDRLTATTRPRSER
jgi:hypothetical protein